MAFDPGIKAKDVLHVFNLFDAKRLSVSRTGISAMTSVPNYGADVDEDRLAFDSLGFIKSF